MSTNSPEYRRQYYEDNKEAIKAYARDYYKANQEKMDGYKATWRKNNPEKKSGYSKKNYDKNIIEYRKRHREYSKEIKRDTLIYYGNGKLQCVLCGFDNMDALTIDHINGNGSKHRNQIGGGGGATYRWLRKNNYPEGYRTLCANCQLIECYRKLTEQMQAEAQGLKPPQ